MKRKIFISVNIILICGIIITSIFIFKNNIYKVAVDSKSTETNDPTPITTPEDQIIPSIQPDTTKDEPKTGEILFEKNVNLDEDNSIEIIQIEKIIDSTNNEQYNGVLKISDEDNIIRVPFLKRSEGNPMGIFDSVEFVDLDNDSINDVFITIPDVGNEFSISYFFAYNYIKQKTYFYQYDNIDLVADLINGFNFNYNGKGILSIKNDSYNFKSHISIKDNSGYTDSEALNKAVFNKAWMPVPPVDIDQNSNLILLKTDKNIIEVKIPLPIFGQATTDILGEIDAYFSFNRDFVPVLKRFEVMEFHGNVKKIVGIKKVQ